MNDTRQSSRDIADMNAGLAERWKTMQSRFRESYPQLAQPFLTQTYRSPADQTADYERGRTKPGKIVTNAKAGESLHNYYPALAFDIAFKDEQGNVNWSQDLMNKLGAIGLATGLGWGGAWRGKFHDYPHYEPPNFSWHDAAAGKLPQWG